MTDDFIEAFVQAGCDASPSESGLTKDQQHEYTQQKEEYNRLFGEIEQKLGSDYKLLRRLEETVNSMYAIEEERVYHKGFSDCMHLLRWMHAFD